MPLRLDYPLNWMMRLAVQQEKSNYGHGIINQAQPIIIEVINMNNLFFIVLTLCCIFLTGCERTIIEANKITCHEDNYEKSLSEIKDKSLQ